MKNKNRIVLLITFFLPTIAFLFIFPYLIQQIQFQLFAKNYILFLSPYTYIDLVLPSLFYGFLLFGLLLGSVTRRIKFKNKKNERFWTFKEKEWKLYRIFVLVCTIPFFIFCILSIDNYIGITKEGIVINKFLSLTKTKYSFNEIEKAEIKGEPYCAGKYSSGEPLFSTIFNLYLPNKEVVDIWGSGMAGTPKGDTLIDVAKILNSHKVKITAVPLNYNTPPYKGCSTLYPYLDPNDPQNKYLSDFINTLYSENLIDN